MANDILTTFNPKNCIASKIQKSSRIINNIFRQHLKQLDLSNSQVSILFVLSKRKTITQKGLADFLYLEKSTVNRNIDRLVKKDLLIINRQKQIEITQSGIDLTINIIPIWQNAMKVAEEKLGKEGVHSLDKVLHSLTK